MVFDLHSLFERSKKHASSNVQVTHDEYMLHGSMIFLVADSTALLSSSPFAKNAKLDNRSHVKVNAAIDFDIFNTDLFSSDMM